MLFQPTTELLDFYLPEVIKTSGMNTYVMKTFSFWITTLSFEILIRHVKVKTHELA